MNGKTIQIKPKEKWKRLNVFHRTILEDDWYDVLVKLESAFMEATFLFYKKKDISFIALPITTGSISSPMGLGSDSLPVEVKICGIKTFLADSMQFFLEFFCRINKKGCYYLSNSFRGEKSDKRHLCQFIHSEVEIVGNLDDAVKLAEEYIHFLCNYYLDNYKKEILSVCENIDHIEKCINLSKIKRCTFNDAIKILGNKEEYFEDCIKYRKITHLGEQELIKHFEGFVWLTNFDYLAVPFYQKSRNNKESINADLLMGIGETVGLGERHLTDIDVKKALKIHKVSIKKYSWYIHMKKIKRLQTSGFGMGMERFLMWLLKQDDIRNMQLVPRFNGKKSVF